MNFMPVRTLSSAASLAALLVFTSSAFSADVTLSNVTVTSPNGKSTVTLSRVDVKNTNLTQDEVAKLFSAATSKQERAAITAKMKADSVLVPEAIMKRSDRPGQISFKGFSVTGVNQGKFGELKLEGFEGKVPEKKSGGDVTFTSGPMIVKDGNLVSAIGTIKDGNVADANWQLGSFSWNGFQVSFPEKTRGGSVYHTIKIGSVIGETKYNGTVPTKSVMEAKDMIFIPAANSQAGQGMAMFGYKQVNLGLVMDGVYEEKAKRFKLNDFTIKGNDTAVLSIAALFGNIDKAAFNGDRRQKLMSLMNGDVDNLTIKFVNNGLMEKAIAFYGRMKGAQPEAVKQEWAGMAGGMLPMFLGGDAGAMQSASAVTDFIKSPKNLTVDVSGKAGAVPFSSFAQMSNPMQLLGKLKIEAVANK